MFRQEVGSRGAGNGGQKQEVRQALLLTLIGDMLRPLKSTTSKTDTLAIGIPKQACQLCFFTKHETNKAVCTLRAVSSKTKN